MNEQTNPELLPDDDNRAPDDDNRAPDAAPGNDGSAEVEATPPTGEVVQAEPDAPAFDIGHVKRVLEAALLSSTEPLGVQPLKRLFGGQVDADNIRKVLDELKDEWSERSIELTAVASGWRFRVKPQYQEFLDRISSEKPPRYSRAVLETLAIIAYRQPVTRGDIEDIRGVAVSPPTLKALEERGWIETVGHRETPGRPALFATTRKFLDDLNLRSLEELPTLEDLQAALEPAPALALRQEPLIAEAAEEAQAGDAEEAAVEIADEEGEDVEASRAEPMNETDKPRDEETPSGEPAEPEEPEAHAG